MMGKSGPCFVALWSCSANKSPIQLSVNGKWAKSAESSCRTERNIATGCLQRRHWESSVQCSNCGTSLRPTAKICIACGTPVLVNCKLDVQPAVELSTAPVNQLFEVQARLASSDSGVTLNVPSTAPDPRAEVIYDPVALNALPPTTQPVPYIVDDAVDLDLEQLALATPFVDGYLPSDKRAPEFIETGSALEEYDDRSNQVTDTADALVDLELEQLALASPFLDGYRPSDRGAGAAPFPWTG